MIKNLIFLVFLLAAYPTFAAPLFFHTDTKASACFSAGKGSKEVRDFYRSKLSPEEKTKLAESIADLEAKSLVQSIECVHRLNLSKEEKGLLVLDYLKHKQVRESLFTYFENLLLSDEKTVRLSAFEEKTLRNFISAKKELSARLSQAELESLSEKTLPLSSFTNTYLAILFQHWEFYQTSPDFLKEGLLEQSP